jgi:hypothetical protein
MYLYLYLYLNLGCLTAVAFRSDIVGAANYQ